MIMIDTNVIIDLLRYDPAWYDWSFESLSMARFEHEVVASAIVVGELATFAQDTSELQAILQRFGIGVRDLGIDAAYRAGSAQLAYRRAGGKRDKILGDFLIGAHAVSARAALITRDPRYYRRYFPDLKLVCPSKDDHD